MKELLNKVSIKGELVKNTINEFQTKKDGTEAIGGSLILRTADGSEHEVQFYSNKYKKDENGNFTSELNYFYEKYADAMENLRDIESCSDDEKPSIISITDGTFTDNDFKGTDGNVISSNKINARFINTVNEKDLDSTILEAKFEVEGVISKIEDEIRNDNPTGNVIVEVVAIGQKADGFGKDANYSADKIIPIKMIVTADMAQAFKNAGYYEGCFAKFVGNLVNTTEVTKTVEKAAFGNDIEKEVTHTVRMKKINSATSPSSIYEHELTDDIINQLKNKRKAKLEEVKNSSSSSSSSTGFEKVSSAPNVTYNPFAQN